MDPIQVVLTLSVHSDPQTYTVMHLFYRYSTSPGITTSAAKRFPPVLLKALSLPTSQPLPGPRLRPHALPVKPMILW